MKSLAPSKRLAANLAALNGNLELLCERTHFVLRNRYNPSEKNGNSYIKESDSIMVYAPVYNEDCGYDFAIGFDFLGKEEADMTAEVRLRHHVKGACWNDHLTALSVELNKRVVVSEKMTINEFRQRLNLLVKLTAPFNGAQCACAVSDWEDVIEIVKNIFGVGEPVNVNEANDQHQLLALQREGELYVEQSNANLLKARLTFDAACEDYSAAMEKVNVAMATSHQVQELQELEKRIAILKRESEELLDAFNEQHRTATLKKQADDAKLQYEKASRSKQKIVSEFMRKVPAYIALKLKL